MNARTVLIPLVAVACLSARADVDVYAETVGGLTGAEQFTNALARAESGATIVVHPGTYDFTGIHSSLKQYSWGPDLFYTNHVSITKAVTIRGDVTGHWSDEVVFTGNFRGIMFDADVPVEISGITFRGFSSGTIGASTVESSHCGGAVRFARRWAAGDPNHGDATRLTNCVVRACTGANGSGVWGGLLVDCLVTDCTSTSLNPVGRDVRLIASTIANNSCTGDYTLQNPNGVYDCVFSNNTATTGSALVYKYQGPNQTMPVSNTVFIANKMTAGWMTTGIVGLEDSTGNGDLTVMDCTFVGNASTSGSACTTRSSDNLRLENCLFVCNTNLVYYDYDGAIAYTASDAAGGKLFVNGCRFERNYAAHGTAGVNGGIVSNTVFDANVSGTWAGACAYSAAGTEVTLAGCTFVNNSAKEGSALTCRGKITVYDSYFGTNTCVGPGGVVYSYAGGQMEFYGCTFERNASSGSAGGVTYGPAHASNCVFRANSGQRGGAMCYQGVAVGCTFENNRITGDINNNGGGTAMSSTLRDCKISGGGFWCCALLNCECRDLDDGCFALYGANWATNCLFTTTADYARTDWGYIYRNATAITDMSTFGRQGSYVNCTFSDIVWDWTYGLSCDDAFPDWAGGYKDFEQTFENCIFQNNSMPDGTRIDFRYLTSKATDTYIKFRNCLYGSSADLTKVEDLGGNIVCDDVQFAKNSKSARYVREPSYSLQATSPARDKGLTMPWMADATDIRGTNRVCNVVDIGCYEFWHEDRGMVLFLK